MEYLATLNIFDNPSSLPRQVADGVILNTTGSLVAWYPVLDSEGGQQAIFVSDIGRDKLAKAGAVVCETLSAIGIDAHFALQEVGATPRAEVSDDLPRCYK